VLGVQRRDARFDGASRDLAPRTLGLGVSEAKYSSMRSLAVAAPGDRRSDLIEPRPDGERRAPGHDRILLAQPDQSQLPTRWRRQPRPSRSALDPVVVHVVGVAR
jgi:hypothetical protein